MAGLRGQAGVVPVLLLASWVVPCQAKQYVVDQKHAAASDSNPGTAHKPLKTVKRSLELVQAGDKVVIRPGDYVEGSLILRTSGTKSQPIVFEAEVPGTATIAGGPRLAKFTRSEFPLLVGPPHRDPQNPERFIGALRVSRPKGQSQLTSASGTMESGSRAPGRSRTGARLAMVESRSRHPGR